MALTLHYPFLTNPSLTGHDAEGLASSTPDLSITRATKATMVDADGYIREVQAGEARFTGATWAQNVCLQSEDFSTSWTPSSKGSIVTNATTDPNGGSTADQLIDDGSTGSGFIIVTSNDVTMKAGQQFTFSVYAKKGTLDWINLNINAFTGLGDPNAYFDLTNGVVGAAPGADVNATSISDEGDGWYRCSVTYTIEADAVGGVRIVAAEADGDNSIADADGTNYIYIWGAQVEVVDGKASTNPGTYIPTTTVAKSSLTGTSTKGLLVEEARTNICLQSEDFSTTWTTAGSVTLTTNDAVSPDGSTTADKFECSSAGSAILDQFIGAVSTSTAYTFSVYAKTDSNSTWLAIETLAFTTPGNVYTYFDIATGAVGTTGTGHTAGIEAAGNGYYRCWITFTTDGTDTNGTMRLALADGNTDLSVATGDFVHVWGAQLEAGAFPTSYIATTTASVTRNADDVNATSASLTATEGSLYTKFRFDNGVIGASVTNVGVLCELNDGTTNNRIWQQSDSGADLNAFITSAAGDDGLIAPNETLLVGTEYQAAIAWQTDDFVQYLDGAASGTQDTALDPITETLTNVYVGSLSGSSQINGHIAEIAYWDERLDNDTLSGLSAGTTTIQSAGGGVLERKRRQHYRRQKLRAQGIRARETWAGSYRGRRT